MFEQDIAEALNLAHPSSETDCIDIGYLPFGLNKTIVSTVVHEFNKAALEIESQRRERGEDVEDEYIKIPSFDEYLTLSKLAPKIKNELITADLKIEFAQEMVGDINVDAFKQRQRDYNSLKKYIDPDGSYGERLAETDKKLDRYDPDKYIFEAKLKRAVIGASHVPAVIDFAMKHFPEVHTPDWQGYMNFLMSTSPDVFEIATTQAMRTKIKTEDMKRHTYIVGGTGSGKSELIKTIVRSHAEHAFDSAVVVLDPHGDMAENLAKWRGFNVLDRLVYLDPFLAETENKKFSINPLQPPPNSTAQELEVIAQQLVGAFQELLKGSGGTGITVNMRAILMPCLLVLLDAGDKTLADLQVFFNDDHNDQLIALGKNSHRTAVAKFFETEFHDRHFTITKQSLRTKLQSLFNSGTFYNLVNNKTSVDLESLIDQKKVILFNLSKGVLGPEASEAFGRFIIALLQGMALRRQSVAIEHRTPVFLFIDECQNYIGNSTVTILEEARKYGVHLTLAQQVAGRGMSPEVRTVVLNNTNIKLVGRTAEDQRMPKLLGLELETVQKLDVGHFYCRAGNGEVFWFFGTPPAPEDHSQMTTSDWELERQSQIQEYYQKTGEVVERSPSSSVDLV